LAFSPSGEKLYCGFKNAIRIFNTDLPGRQCEMRNLKCELHCYVYDGVSS
jgi:hypothetical protein